MKKIFLLFSLLIVTASVFSQWTDDASENTLVYSSEDDETIPKIATDQAGNTFIAFFSNASGNYDVLLQYYNEDGVTYWDEPLMVSDHNQQSWLSNWAMEVDYEGNAIITFSDTRTGNPDIQIYKISPEGEFLWGGDGINCSLTPEAEYEPRLSVAENNTAYVTFIRPRTTETDQLVVSAIDEAGNKLLGENGLIFTSESEEYYADPYVVSSGEDAILVYSLNSGSFPSADRILYANKIDDEGNELWDSPALISDASGIAGFTDLSVISDKTGGVFISWHDDRDNDMNSSGFVQHISSSGEVLMDEDGTEVATQSNVERFNPYVALNDPEGGEISVFWRQTDASQSQSGLYGQRFNGDGERLWGENGAEILPVGATFGTLYGTQAMDTTTSLVVYSKVGDGTDEFMHAMALDDLAEPVWPGTSTEMSVAPSGITSAVLGAFTQEQVVVAWQDSRDNNGIYAQNIHSDGTIGINDTEIPDLIDDEISVYPNPADDVFTIKANLFSEVVIRNSLGQIVSRRTMDNNGTIRFEPKSSGVYFITFTNGNRNITKKAVVRRNNR